MFNAITDVEGILVGHASDLAALTGCTVILCENGAVGGVEVRGFAADTRQIDALGVMHFVGEVHGILLAGGSAFGLDAVGGVMKYLEEKRKGLNVGIAHVPIIPSAIIFDLDLGDFRVRPDKQMGYQACLNAAGGIVVEGSIGVGTGASVGKAFGIGRAMKGGLGTSSGILSNGVVVGVLVVVNAFGGVNDYKTGQIIAGARDSKHGLMLIDSAEQIKKGLSRRDLSSCTNLAVVATNAVLSKPEASQLARMAYNGLARVISPAQTLFDGDVIFALSPACHRLEPKAGADLNALGSLAADLLCEAIQRAVKEADGFGIIPAYKDLKGNDDG
jgi:L-aminopeptidase/D-esterase-like protein